MESSLKWIAANMDVIRAVAEIVISLLAAKAMMNSKAASVIAIVFKIMKEGMELTPEQRLQKASDLMGQKMPYVPEGLRKMVIQFMFDSIAKAAEDPKA